MTTEKDQIERIANELHANGVCDAMFAHYGGAKRCERMAGSLYDAGIRHVEQTDETECSWCPPDCRSGCTRDRDCECYAHQDEPDRHAGGESDD